MRKQSYTKPVASPQLYRTHIDLISSDELLPEVVGSSGDQTGPYRRRMPADTLQAVALHAMLALLSYSPAAVTYHLGWHISVHSPPQMLPC